MSAPQVKVARAKPIVLAVDDEPQVLDTVEIDLRRHFKGECRVIKAGSGAEALEVVRKLKARNAPLALLLVDQRMPGMSGIELLGEARKLYPDARKVLLTAYADTSVAIAAINSVGLDHYLLKPWHPPEQNLYPVLDDLLAEWTAIAAPPWEGIRVAGTLWSSRCHDVKDFLARNRIPYQWLDVENDAAARALVESACEGAPRLPVVFFSDGTVLIDPERRAVADKCGLQTQASRPFYDVLIVGAGPAGLAAAVYAASEGLHTVMVEKEAPGGQAGTSSYIENYVGFPKGLTGSDLAQRATAQARRFGAEILTAQEVVSIRAEEPYKLVTLGDGTELSCYALLLATGVEVRKLDAPGADAFTGAGVYYGAALTEAASYRDQDVFVMGGANSAGQGALFFSRYARKVTMLMRGARLDDSMSRYLADQIRATANIEVWTGTQVLEVKGQQRMEAITLSRDGGAPQEALGAALFVFIGQTPRTDMVASLLERNQAGFILTGPDLMHEGRRPRGWLPGRDPLLLETSVPGIFAAGDVRHGSSKRVAAAVGEGAVAVQLVHQYLKTV